MKGIKQYMKYRITEIFYSIQGEGRYTGYPAIFIRFAGCNLNCDFCDTNYSVNYQLTANEILSEVEQYPCKLIVLTGGEPTIQLNEKLLSLLLSRDFSLHLETNGTIQLNKLRKYLKWVTVSPKQDWIQREGNELKVVYEGQNLEQYNDSRFDYYYLQPCERNGKYNFDETIKAVKESDKWKLSIQTQKLLKIR